MKPVLVLLTLLSGVLSLTAQAAPSSACKFKCYVPPQCEQLAKATELQLFATNAGEFQLWSVDVIGDNPMSPPYQVEAYGIPSTPATPGHLIYISHGFNIPTNPTGACRIELVDGKIPGAE